MRNRDVRNDGARVPAGCRWHSGEVNASFAGPRVWQDANEDGISDAGELKTLAELGRMPRRMRVSERRPHRGGGDPKAQGRAVHMLSRYRGNPACLPSLFYS